MRRDSIFYKLFQQVPTLLFDIVDSPPNAAGYRFESVAVKEPRFEIDGVFLPPESPEPGIVFFCEVQFQKDERLYERMFCELFLYFYRNRDRFSDWRAIVIYPTRKMEQKQIEPYRALLNGDQVHRIFLNELGNINHLPLGIALMCLTTVEPNQSAEEARQLIDRAKQEDMDAETRRSIIEIITTILAYQFPNLTRVEVEKMLDIKFEETQVYRDVYQDALAEGTAKGRAEGRAEGKAEGKAEGEQQGRQKEAVSIIIRQLSRRLKQSLPGELQTQVESLPLSLLEELSEALLDFETPNDLGRWLDQRQD